MEVDYISHIPKIKETLNKLRKAIGAEKTKIYYFNLEEIQHDLKSLKDETIIDELKQHELNERIHELEEGISIAISEYKLRKAGLSQRFIDTARYCNIEGPELSKLYQNDELKELLIALDKVCSYYKVNPETATFTHDMVQIATERVMDHGWSNDTLRDLTDKLNKEVGANFTPQLSSMIMGIMAESTQHMTDEWVIGKVKSAMQERLNNTPYVKQLNLVLRADNLRTLFGYSGIDLLRAMKFNGKDKRKWPYVITAIEDVIQDELEGFALTDTVIHKLNMLSIDKYKDIQLVHAISIQLLKDYFEFIHSDLYTDAPNNVWDDWLGIEDNDGYFD